MAEISKIDLRRKDIYVCWAKSTIRYSDLDPNGHVNNGAINEFFEDGRVCFRDERMLRMGDDILAGFALVKFSVDYITPLYFPGSVEIGTVVIRIGNSSYDLGQGIFNGEECVAIAEVVTVFFDFNTKKSKNLTTELKDILRGASANN